ncbi:hypothetical protein [Spirosoma fluminis]
MHSLKKYLLLALTTLTLSSSLMSCVTVFGGRVTDEQKRRPAPGESRREIRVGGLIADILLFPLISIPVDFATGAIYKPKYSPTAQKAPAATTQQVNKR